MKSSKRVTELNNRSVELTDAELRFVDKFSVSLPMNELPEVVVVSPQPVAPRQNYDGPATIPFKFDEPESNPTHGDTNELLKSKFAEVETPSSVASTTAASTTAAPASDGPTSDELASDMSLTDANAFARDSNGISVPDIEEAESTLLDTHPVGTQTTFEPTSQEDSELESPTQLDSETETKETDTEETTDPADDFAGNLELPKDELDILSSDKSPSPDSQRAASAESMTDATAIYKIEDYALHEDRFERIAKSIEAELENKPTSVVLMTSPTSTDSFVDAKSIQQTTANNLLSVLANRNPTMRIISVQANESTNDQDEHFSPGLGEVLSEENELEEVVIPTTIDNLDYLAFSDCGSVLSSSFKPRVEKIVSELRKHYDLIFIIGKSAEEMETKSWTAIADATYLTVQLYGDDQASAIAAAAQLRKNGGRLVGCIVIEPE